MNRAAEALTMIPKMAKQARHTVMRAIPIENNRWEYRKTPSRMMSSAITEASRVRHITGFTYVVPTQSIDCAWRELVASSLVGSLLVLMVPPSWI